MYLIISGKMKHRLLTSQILKVMKLTFILLFATALSLSAKSVAQTVTFAGKDVTLQTVFNAITKQTGYTVFCNYELLRNAKTVTLNFRNEPIERAMEECLKGQALTYSIIQNSIVIKAKAQTKSENEISVISPPPPMHVSGRVVNEKAEPVAGVTVTVKGTNNATATDATGSFVLPNVVPEAILVFTAVNAETIEVKVNAGLTWVPLL